MILIVALVVVIALSAQSCASTPECCITGPAPDTAPLLVTGDYRVEVVSVQSVACRGAEPSEFEGQVAWGFLDADRAQAGGGPIGFDLEGVRLDGVMNPGWLSASGGLEVTQTDERGADDTEASDTGRANQRGSSSTSSSSSGGTSSGGGSTHTEPPDGDPSEASASLEVRVMSAERAEGTLTVVAGECSYTVAVRMDLDDSGAEPPVADTGVADTDRPDEPNDDKGDSGDTKADTGSDDTGSDDTASGDTATGDTGGRCGDSDDCG